MLRWALLGTGAAAARYAPAFRACGHDLAAVASHSLTRAQGFAANHGVRRARGALGDVLEAPDVDAVLVALPNDLHEGWAVAALEAGKHVLCAAPLAPDSAAGGRMAAASARAGLVLAHGLAHRFHPVVIAALDTVWAGGIGDVRLVSATVSSRVRDPRSYRTRVERGGGALLDVGVHAVAAARWFAGGEPVRVGAAHTRWSTGVDGTVGAALAFPSGAVATLLASFDAGVHDTLEVVGTTGTLRLPGAFSAGAEVEARLERDGALAGTWRTDPFERMAAAFAVAVAGRDVFTPGIDDAVATIEACDRIRDAAEAAGKERDRG